MLDVIVVQPRPLGQVGGGPDQLGGGWVNMGMSMQTVRGSGWIHSM